MILDVLRLFHFPGNRSFTDSLAVCKCQSRGEPRSVPTTNECQILCSRPYINIQESNNVEE